MTFNDLPAYDQHTICHALHLPTPTHELTIDIILAPFPAAVVLACLEHDHSLRAMMALAALSGRLTRLPPDARLYPKPWPKAPMAAALAAPVASAPKPQPGKPRVLASIKPNPKRPGSAARDRYALYQLGLTEAELLAVGLWRADFRHDTQRGFVTWR